MHDCVSCLQSEGSENKFMKRLYFETSISFASKIKISVLKSMDYYCNYYTYYCTYYFTFNLQI